MPPMVNVGDLWIEMSSNWIIVDEKSSSDLFGFKLV